MVFPFFGGGGIETIVSCTSSYSLPGINIRARTVLAHTTLEYAYITSIAVFKRTWMTYYAQLCFLIAAGVVGGCRGVGRGRRVPSSAGAPGPSQLPNPQPPQARDTVTCSRKLGGAHIRAVAFVPLQRDPQHSDSDGNRAPPPPGRRHSPSPCLPARRLVIDRNSSPPSSPPTPTSFFPSSFRGGRVPFTPQTPHPPSTRIGTAASHAPPKPPTPPHPAPFPQK